MGMQCFAQNLFAICRFAIVGSPYAPVRQRARRNPAGLGPVSPAGLG